MGILTNVREAIKTFVAPGDEELEDNEMNIEQIVAVHPALLTALKDMDKTTEDVEQDPYARTDTRKNFTSKYKGRKGTGGEEMTAAKLEKMRKTLTREQKDIEQGREINDD